MSHVYTMHSFNKEIEVKNSEGKSQKKKLMFLNLIVIPCFPLNIQDYLLLAK